MGLLWINSQKKKNIIEIAVVGCGVIGLTSAIEIQSRLGTRGKVTIFSDKFSPNTTGDIAAGLWEPYLLGDNSMDNILKWSQDTYKYILKLWKEGKAKETGICLIPVITLFNDKNYTLPNWVTATIGYNDLSARHLESLSKQYNKNFTGGFLMTSFTWEPVIFLPYMQQKFLERGGIIFEKHIESFNELEKFDVILNCTGIEARNLSKDVEVIPIRGQVMRVEAPWQYVCYSVMLNEDEDSCYVIPNTESVVVGGTKQKSFDLTVNKEDSALFTKNSFKLLPALADSRKMKEVVGLRPARSKVRLEEEFLRTPNGKILKIVHNYGHGGAGITLCVGCANDAADLVEKLINVDKNKL